MSSLCIGCACDEHHACVVDGTHGCAWLRNDSVARVGVCSRCEDQVEAFDAGARALQLGLVAERFYRQAMPIYDDMLDAMAWMEAPQKLLESRVPRELILEGKISEVRTVLDQLLDGAYI